MNKEEDNLVIGFINKFNELKNSYQETFFNKSFNTDIVEKNIELVKQKRYAITDEIWNIDESLANSIINSILEIISVHASEYTEISDRLKTIITNDSLFAKSFILDVLTNKVKKIFDFARNNQLSIDFITFLAIFTAYPFRKSIADYVRTKVELKGHISGYCPICGHWPGMSYIIGKEGKKVMSCICCGTFWSFRRLQCSFCLTTEHEALGYLNIEDEKEISAYICDKCRRYLKTIRIEDDKFDYDEESAILDYMTSGDIDIASVQNKYLQESILSTRFDGPNDKHIELYINKLDHD